LKKAQHLKKKFKYLEISSTFVKKVQLLKKAPTIEKGSPFELLIKKRSTFDKKFNF